MQKNKVMLNLFQHPTTKVSETNKITSQINGLIAFITAYAYIKLLPKINRLAPVSVATNKLPVVNSIKRIGMA